MRPRTLLVLLVLVLGLGAFIALYERKLPSTEERAELQKKVLPVKKDEITAISIRSDAGTVRLERTPQSPAPARQPEKETPNPDVLPAQPDAEWRMTEPFRARADALAVDGLLEAVTGLEKTRTLDDVDRKAVGLDRPRVTVRIRTAQGEKVLDLGAQVPNEASVIAAVEGQKGAAVVGDSVLSELRKNPGDWRDHQMYRGERDTVQRIALSAQGHTVVLTRDGDDFRLTAPIADRADADLIDNLFAELGGLTAESFDDRPKPLPEIGLAPPRGPRAIIEVAFRGAPPQRFELGAAVPSAESATSPTPPSPGEPPPAPRLYARAGSQIFETRTRLLEAAERAPAAWRSPAVSSLDVYQVEKATLQDARGSLSLERAGTDWKRGAETISYLPVSDLLFALTGARGERVLTAQEARELGVTFGRPALTAILSTKAPARTETLRFFPAVAAGVPVQSSDRETVLLLPPDKLGELQGKLADVRSAKPVSDKKGK
jgi:hypothetical protein